MAQKYKAFISYSHKDRQWAAWLHKRLETYSFPKHIIGQETRFGPVPATLKPIFRDRDELSAGADLGEKIEAALKQTQTLIVICSPQAAKSHWVNQEVLFFKRHCVGANIFAVIIDGEPFSQGEMSDQECFPPALRFQLGDDGTLSEAPAEPLAADLRDKAEGKRLGLLKLISGMAGLGLDDLVQRDLRRARRRVTAVTTGAITAMLVMGSLTWLAVDARGEADKRRNDAEGLTEFMLTDLKDKLEPIGKLDIMDGVAEKVIRYYENYDANAFGCETARRHARALHLAAEIANSSGDIDAFSKSAKEAFEITERNLTHCKDQDLALYDHGLSSFWRGYYALSVDNMEAAHGHFTKYLNTAQTAARLNGRKDIKYDLNIAQAYSTLGAMRYITGNVEDAQSLFEQSRALFETLINQDKQLNVIVSDYSNTLGWLALCAEKNSRLDKSIAYRLEETAILDDPILGPKLDKWKMLYAKGSANRHLSKLYTAKSNPKRAYKHAIQAEKIFNQLNQHDKDNQDWLEALAYSQSVIFELALENHTEPISAISERLRRTLNKFASEDSIHKQQHFKTFYQREEALK